jgi:hypothetical protein
MTAEHERLRTLLSDAAVEFRSGRRTVALPLVALANRHGIEVWTQGTPSRGTHVAQINLEGRVSIFLYRTGIQPGSRRLAPEDEVRLTVRERFSIAHELAHWVLLARGGHARLAQGGKGDDHAYRADEPSATISPTACWFPIGWWMVGLTPLELSLEFRRYNCGGWRHPPGCQSKSSRTLSSAAARVSDS